MNTGRHDRSLSPGVPQLPVAPGSHRHMSFRPSGGADGGRRSTGSFGCADAGPRFILQIGLEVVLTLVGRIASGEFPLLGLRALRPDHPGSSLRQGAPCLSFSGLVHGHQSLNQWGLNLGNSTSGPFSLIPLSSRPHLGSGRSALLPGPQSRNGRRFGSGGPGARGPLRYRGAVARRLGSASEQVVAPDDRPPSTPPKGLCLGPFGAGGGARR